MNDSTLITELSANWARVRERVANAAVAAGRLPEEITIVAVSKTHPPTMLSFAIQAGITVLGENYARELQEKHDFIAQTALPQPEWHFIGHLQTNKVKYIMPYVNLIHSVDSVHLASEIARQATKHNCYAGILLQVNTSGEQTKSGCEPGELTELAKRVMEIENIELRGLMTIGSFSDDESVTRREYSLLRSLRQELHSIIPPENLVHLSMGMSGDFELAIAEGSTIVRIGTAVFGLRSYA